MQFSRLLSTKSGETKSGTAKQLLNESKSLKLIESSLRIIHLVAHPQNLDSSACRIYSKPFNSPQPQGAKNPSESEIIINVPLALQIMTTGYIWPIEAWEEVLNEELWAWEEDITVSPR